jgi:hypothetical protein
LETRGSVLKGHDSALKVRGSALKGHDSALKGHDSALKVRGSALKGHDSALKVRGSALETRGLSSPQSPLSDVLKGHDFSRAVNGAIRTWALAPEGCFLGNFFSPCFAAPALSINPCGNPSRPRSTRSRRAILPSSASWS